MSAYARLLYLDHAADRQEIADRFRLGAEVLHCAPLMVTNLPPHQAELIAQRVRDAGQTAATARANGTDDLLLNGPWTAVASALQNAAPEVASMCATAMRWTTAPAPPLVAGPYRLPMDGRPLLVGILNATPDSFYDRGRYFGLERSLARAEEMLTEGADVIEVGGETLRPAVPGITAGEEVSRVVPIVEVLRGRVSVPLAVDTFKPDVARAALAAGASIVNDVSGLADERMARLAADAGAALVITHIQGRPKVANRGAHYARVIDEVYSFLAHRTARAEAMGVLRESLIVDPGLSLGKQPAHDVAIVRRFREFRSLGLPIYLAASRKNFIRDVLGLPFEELLEGTMAVVACGVLAGANLVRTHDVRAVRRLVNMLWAITGPPPAVMAAAPPGDR